MLENKRAIVPNPSVGADGEQPQSITTNDIISEEPPTDNSEDEALDYEKLMEQMERISDPAYLHTVSMTELYQTVYQSRPPIIDGLLYAGAYILAGAPKIGKSFLVAQIAYHVSTGKNLWGFETRQGVVLYLALEDDYRRIQGRMFQMYGENDTPNLLFATSAQKVGNGLDEQLEKFLKEHHDTRLIVVDTLQKVREAVGEAYSYSGDYDLISKLKHFADKHGICVLIVHHTRKQMAGDTFDMISGTTGLLGCADGAFIMQKKKRTDLDATLDITGRDQQDQVLYILKDAVTQVWSLQRTETQPWIEPPDEILSAVAALVTESSPEWTGSPTELAQAIGLDIAPNTLTKHLNIKCGRLLDEHNIQYENKLKHAGRRIKLTYQVAE